MPRIIHFEIAADQPDRAAKFYSQVFGWKIQKWEGPVNYWLVTTGEGGTGINGALKERASPSVSTVNTIDVPSLDEFLARIKGCGGKVVTPKAAIPGIGYHAYCQDRRGQHLWDHGGRQHRPLSCISRGPAICARCQQFSLRPKLYGLKGSLSRNANF